MGCAYCDLVALVLVLIVLWVRGLYVTGNSLNRISALGADGGAVASSLKP